MNQRIKSIVIILLLNICFLSFTYTQSNYKLKSIKTATNSLDFCLLQYKNLLSVVTDTTKFPRKADSGGLRLVGGGDWTSGFFPGALWYLYEYSGDTYWKNKAMKWTNTLKNQQFNNGSHDIGFIINCSFGNGYRLVHSPFYPPVMIQSSKTLSSLFNPLIGCTKSWTHNVYITACYPTKLLFPVIIDNMMNLELLFKGSTFSNDSQYYKRAVSHANRTMLSHVRLDSTTFHVADFDPLTGQMTCQGTKQGYSDSSTWARGQAWAIYGYTMMYRETYDTNYLHTVKKVLAYFLNNLPSDNVPFYDFKAPAIPNEYKDASASAITASALVDLYKFTGDSFYIKNAEKILDSLSSPKYQNALGTNYNFILRHSTGGKNYETDIPMNYADYYYIEALVKYLYLDTSFVFPNHTPEFLTYKLDTAFKNIEFKQQLSIFDFDNDSLSLVATNLPNGFYLDSTSLLKGTPDSSGVYLIKFVLSDKIKDTTVYLPLFIDVNPKTKEYSRLNDIRVFPNPFTDEVTISLISMNDKKIELRILDNLGKQIKIFPQINIYEGKNEFKWNGKDNSGKVVTNGNYFIQIKDIINISEQVFVRNILKQTK